VIYALLSVHIVASIARVHGYPEFISLTTAAAYSSATKRLSFTRCKFATITLQRGPRV